MRVVFMGTPAFAVPSLRAVAARHEVVAVYTRPDRGSGRGRRVAPGAVKEEALATGLPVHQPSSLRDAAEVERLEGLAPDVIVVAAYGLILPREVLDVPPHGCVNVHASLLPRWRGAAPVQRAILAGDAVTGVSIMRMEEGLDTGPYAAVRQVPVGERDAAELTDLLAEVGADALMETLESIGRATVSWTPQDEGSVTYAAKITAADVALDPSLTTEAALRRVRSSGPSAPCRMMLDGRRVVVVRASSATPGPGQGTARCDDWPVVGVADGSIVIEELIPEGRGRMSGDAFCRGVRLSGDRPWGAAS